MNVKELIEELRWFDSDLEVMIHWPDVGHIAVHVVEHNHIDPATGKTKITGGGLPIVRLR
jgi:hypothetical protein